MMQFRDRGLTWNHNAGIIKNPSTRALSTIIEIRLATNWILGAVLNPNITLPTYHYK